MTWSWILALSDTVPRGAVSSLNASVAAAIALYEAALPRGSIATAALQNKHI